MIGSITQLSSSPFCPSLTGTSSFKSFDQRSLCRTHNLPLVPQLKGEAQGIWVALGLRVTIRKAKGKATPPAPTQDTCQRMTRFGFPPARRYYGHGQKARAARPHAAFPPQSQEQRPLTTTPAPSQTLNKYCLYKLEAAFLRGDRHGQTRSLLLFVLLGAAIGRLLGSDPRVPLPGWFSYEPPHWGRRWCAAQRPPLFGGVDLIDWIGLVPGVAVRLARL
jgi:hypothetical protein